MDLHYVRKQAEAKLSNTYGLNFESWARLYEFQRGKCSCCSKQMALNGKQKDSALVDYCKTMKKVGGLVCCSCNLKIIAARNGRRAPNEQVRTYIERAKWKNAFNL